MGYDLHVHSSYSDGTMKPAELVAQACSKRLSGMALTDHDTIAGIREGLVEAERRKLLFIPGVELTTDWGEAEVHILGYNFQLDNPRLNRKLDAVLEARNDRARQILKKLNLHRIPLSWEKVKAQTTSNFVGRAHIFKALQASGQIRPEHRRNAFEYYLGKNGIAFVPHQEIDTLEAIEIINESGGIPVLAHPGRMGDDGLIERLVDAGLKGIEVYYPSHTPELVEYYLDLCRRFQLIITGGSDYHGAFSQTRLGEAVAPEIPWFRDKFTTLQ